MDAKMDFPARLRNGHLVNLRLAARWLVLVVVVGSCASAAWFLAWHSLQVQRLFAQAPSQAAGVVTADPAPNSNLVFYRFEAGGKQWTGDFQADRVWSDYRVGDALPIYYLASDPSIHSTKRPVSGDLERLMAEYTFGGAIVVLFTGLLMYRWLTKPKREPLMLDTREFEGSQWIV